jgi:uncharacterized protein YjiS (DUF1127 family)
MPETGAMRFLKDIVFVWVQYRHFQAAHAELRRMTDRELADLGLTRDEIGWVAFTEAERRTEADLATPDWPARGGRRADAGGLTHRRAGLQT